MNDDALERLCRAAGIAPGYSDIWGNIRVASDDTRCALLTALGIPATENDAAQVLDQEETLPWRRTAPPVVVCRENRLPYRVTLNFPESVVDETHAWRLAMESGASRTGEFRARQLELLESRFINEERHVRVAFDWREALPTGYHRFILQSRAANATVTSLIIAPERCYLPPALRDGGRAWGIATQLYGLVSSRGWGMGDFTDLSLLIEQWGRRGADFIGVNPLHALYPHNPAHASPYSPSSRRFLNPLYLDVEAVEDLHECREARQELRSAAFRQQLQSARGSKLVDYPAVARLKLPLLEQLYAHFVERHLRPGSARSRAFREFQSAEGAALRRHALYQALQQHFHDSDPGIWGFPAWPEAYRNPDSLEVARFTETHAHRVEFHEYLQWQCGLQLGAVAERCRHLGMEVGLYTDIAVSIDSAGSDAWSDQRNYALGATLGAPPDEINRDGQNWGLPPLHPGRLREAAYAPFIATLRAGMRHAGAVRIDHVMGLYRLFWIPRGGSAADGAYVHYPFEDLLGVLALESQRNRCMVIGEDLGTVPDEVHAGLARTGILSYRLLLFEREATGEFRQPADYPVDALVTATTHDLPTLAGYWMGNDLRLQRSLKQIDDEELAALLEVRADDCARIARALDREGLLPARPSGIAPGNLTNDDALAIQVYLARTPSRLHAVQLEDVLGVTDQANLPGSTEEHPNWRRKLPVLLDAAQDDARVIALEAALSRERPRR